MSQNVSIHIDGVVVGSEGTDDVLAVTQVVGQALKNNGTFAVTNLTIDLEPAES